MISSGFWSLLTFHWSQANFPIHTCCLRIARWCFASSYLYTFQARWGKEQVVKAACTSWVFNLQSKSFPENPTQEVSLHVFGKNHVLWFSLIVRELGSIICLFFRLAYCLPKLNRDYISKQQKEKKYCVGNCYCLYISI